jgi:hypothetical protein
MMWWWMMWCMDYGLETLTFDLCDLTFGTWDLGPRTLEFRLWTLKFEFLNF